ncbi:hypothetical protein J4231_03255 [Candidatus Woesearchaeota archaeon]|nr:hypothetical protein [Candidatus Woesearchaeota archaeon]
MTSNRCGNFFESYSENDLLEKVAEILLGNFKTHHRIVLNFSSKESREAFMKKNRSIKAVSTSLGYHEILEEKSASERLDKMMYIDSKKQGYRIETIFIGEDYIIYEKSSVH